MPSDPPPTRAEIVDALRAELAEAKAGLAKVHRRGLWEARLWAVVLMILTAIAAAGVQSLRK